MCGVTHLHTAFRDPTSPASPESLINQTLDDLVMSPMVAPSPRSGDLPLGPTQLPLQQPDVAFIFSKFVEMLDRGLSQTAARITSDIKHDLQSLGARIETIETKADATVTRANQNTDCIQDLHNQLDVAVAKINNLETRPRRYNFRNRGLP